MQPESLVQLVGSGNTTTVETEWMRLLESPEVTPARMCLYQPVLSELCRMGKQSLAEEWAWTAIEALSTRVSPFELLGIAGAFLLAIGDSPELRGQVCALYGAAFDGRPDFDALLTESGLAGGRPVRRALRTLEVSASLEVGHYLVARDNDGAAKVTALDRPVWQFTIDNGAGTETLGAVELADRFRLAVEGEFRVMRHFAVDRLGERLQNDPAGVVIDLCREHGGSMTSEALEADLVPQLLAEDEFKKWWTRARTALKKLPNVVVEGRSPYTIAFSAAPVDHEESFAAEFEKLREPVAQLRCVEKYLRDCKARGLEASRDALQRSFESTFRHAKDMTAKGAARAGLAWAVAERIGELTGADAQKGLVEFLRDHRDFRSVAVHIDDGPLFDRVCAAFAEARPDDWRAVLSDLLPTLSWTLCDVAASKLARSGWEATGFDPLLQRIVSVPIPHFEALLWLWDGPSHDAVASRVNALTVLTRIVRTLDDCRRGESIDKDRAKSYALLARAAFSARKYDRFRACLDGLEPGMASALRTQIAPLDNLGRAVREDLLDLIKRAFPIREAAASLEPWQRENVLYVTHAALAKKQEEVRHHVNIKMRDNARAIGAAAERGDLSENSEYKFALEERDLLRARLAQMNSEVALAQILNPGDVPTDFLGIGTHVVLERLDDGVRYEMTIAGPWDSDGPQHRFNYKAPLCQGILGRRIGDSVQFDHEGASGTYKIVELSNSLTSPAATDAARPAVSAAAG